MAFNINAQVILSGPKNIQAVNKSIRRQLSGITIPVEIKLAKNATKRLGEFNRGVKSLTANLTKLRGVAAATNRDVKALVDSFDKLSRTSKSVATSTTRMATASGKSADAIKDARSELEAFGKDAALAIRRFTAFTVATGAVFGFVRAIQSAGKAALSFQTEITKVVQVTGANTGKIEKLKSTIDSLSVSLGVDANELAKLARTFAQTGQSIDQVRSSIRAVARSSLAPSFGEMTNTAEGLIAAMAQFNIGASKSEAVLGSLNAVSKKFAVEAEDLVSVIRRAGGVFSTAAGQMKDPQDALNELIGLFTAVRSTTRESADTIATGLRTIFTRIQRRGTIEFLKQFNIELLDARGNFVGLFPAFQRLSEGLRGLVQSGDAITLSAVTEELGGMRQVGKLIPALVNFNKALAATKVAAQGAAQGLGKDVSLALQPLAKQFEQLGARFNTFIRDVSESRTFQNLAKVALETANAFLFVAETLKPLIPLITTLTTIKITKGLLEFGRGFVGGIRKGGGAGGAGGALGGAVTGGGRPPAGGGGDTRRAVSDRELSQALRNSVTAVRANTVALNAVHTALIAVDKKMLLLGQTIQNEIRPLVVALRLSGGPGGGFRPPRPFARGGPVHGPSHAAGGVPAILEGGEYVIPKGYEPGGVADVRRGLSAKRRDRQFSGATTSNVGILGEQGLQGKRVSQSIRNKLNAIPDDETVDSYGGAFLSTPGPVANSLSGQVSAKKIEEALSRTKIWSILKGVNAKAGSPLASLKRDILTQANAKKDFRLIPEVLRTDLSEGIEDTILSNTIKAVEGGAKKLASSTRITGGGVTEAVQILRSSNIDNVIGNLFEAIISNAGVPYSAKDPDAANAPFDFPRGLGDIAGNFGSGRLGSLKTDAKTRYTSGNIQSFLKKVQNTEANRLELALIQALSGAELAQFGFVAPRGGKTGGRGQVQEFLASRAKGTQTQFRAAGGPIFKPRGTDTVPAMLTPGEFVINKSSAQSIGYGQLNKMNHMAKGGPVQYLAGGGPAVGGGLGTVGNLAIVAAGLATTLSSLDTSAMGLFNTLISLQFTMQALGPLMQSSIAKSLGVSTFGKALNKPFLAASIGMKRFSKNLAKGAGARAASASAMRGMATVLGTTTKALAGFGAAAVGAMVIGPVIDAIANSAFGKEETVRGVSGRRGFTAGEAGALGGVKSAAQMGLTGAAIGTMIAPGIGTAIGAAVGTIGGAISGFLAAQENQALFLTLDKLATNGDRVAAIFSKIANEGAGIGGGRTADATAAIRQQVNQQSIAIQAQTIGTPGSFRRELMGPISSMRGLGVPFTAERSPRTSQPLRASNFDPETMQRALERASLTEGQQSAVQEGVSRLLDDTFSNLPVDVLQQISSMGPSFSATGEGALIASARLETVRTNLENLNTPAGDAAVAFIKLRNAAEGSLIIRDANTELKRLRDLGLDEKARAFAKGIGALERDIGVANLSGAKMSKVMEVLRRAMDDAGIAGEQNRDTTEMFVRARRAAQQQELKNVATAQIYTRIMKQAKKATDFFASALSSLSGAFQAAAARFSNGIDGVSSEIDQILTDRFKITAVKSINPFEDVKSATPQELQKGFDRIQRRNPNADISELRALATVQSKLPAILQNTIRREERGQLTRVAGETEQTRLSKDITAQVNALGLNLGKEFFADLEGNIFRQNRENQGKPQAQALSQLRNASEKSGEEISKLGGSATKTLSELTKSLDSFENDLVKSGQNLVKVFQFITKEQLAVLDRREAKEAALDKALGRMPNEMSRATTNLQNRLDVLAGAGGAAAPAQNVTVGELFGRRGAAIQQKAAIGGPKDVSRAAGAAVHAAKSNTDALKMLIKDTTILNATMKELDKSFQQEVDSGRAITQIGQAIVDLRSGKTSPKEFNKQVAGPIAVFEEFFKKLTTGQQVNLTGQQGFELSQALTSGDPLFAAQFEELFRRLAAQRGTDPGTERRRIERDLQGARSRFVQGALPQGPMSDFFKRNEQIRGRSIQEQQAGARNIQIINQQQDRIAKALNIDKLSLVQNQEQKTQILFAAAVVQFAKAVEAFSVRKFNDGGIVKMAKGGQVRGPSHGAGGVLTELEGGEFVIPKKFAEGGSVFKPRWQRDEERRKRENQQYTKDIEQAQAKKGPEKITKEVMAARRRKAAAEKRAAATRPSATQPPGLKFDTSKPLSEQMAGARTGSVKPHKPGPGTMVGIGDDNLWKADGSFDESAAWASIMAIKDPGVRMDEMQKYNREKKHVERLNKRSFAEFTDEYMKLEVETRGGAFAPHSAVTGEQTVWEKHVKDANKKSDKAVRGAASAGKPIPGMLPGESFADFQQRELNKQKAVRDKDTADMAAYRQSQTTEGLKETARKQKRKAEEVAKKEKEDEVKRKEASTMRTKKIFDQYGLPSPGEKEKFLSDREKELGLKSTGLPTAVPKAATLPESTAPPADDKNWFRKFEASTEHYLGKAIGKSVGFLKEAGIKVTGTVGNLKDIFMGDIGWDSKGLASWEKTKKKLLKNYSRSRTEWDKSFAITGKELAFSAKSWDHYVGRPARGGVGATLRLPELVGLPGAIDEDEYYEFLNNPSFFEGMIDPTLIAGGGLKSVAGAGAKLAAKSGAKAAVKAAVKPALRSGPVTAIAGQASESAKTALKLKSLKTTTGAKKFVERKVLGVKPKDLPKVLADSTKTRPHDYYDPNAQFSWPPGPELGLAGARSIGATTAAATKGVGKVAGKAASGAKSVARIPSVVLKDVMRETVRNQPGVSKWISELHDKFPEWMRGGDSLTDSFNRTRGALNNQARKRARAEAKIAEADAMAASRKIQKTEAHQSAFELSQDLEKWRLERQARADQKRAASSESISVSDYRKRMERSRPAAGMPGHPTGASGGGGLGVLVARRYSTTPKPKRLPVSPSETMRRGEKLPIGTQSAPKPAPATKPAPKPAPATKPATEAKPAWQTWKEFRAKRQAARRDPAIIEAEAAGNTRFDYKAIDPSDERVVTGSVSAGSEAEAVDIIERLNGLSLREIRRAKSPAKPMGERASQWLGDVYGWGRQRKGFNRGGSVRGYQDGGNVAQRRNIEPFTWPPDRSRGRDRRVAMQQMGERERAWRNFTPLDDTTKSPSPFPNVGKDGVDWMMPDLESQSLMLDRGFRFHPPTGLKGAVGPRGAMERAWSGVGWRGTGAGETINQRLKAERQGSLGGDEHGNTVRRSGPVGFYNKGGNVDSVPAMLTPGEFVMRKQSVDKYGQKFMNDINLSKVQLANGGGMMGMGGSKKSVSGTSRVGGASQDLEKAAKLATDSIVAGFTKGSEMVKQAIQDALSAESIGQQLASVLGQSLRENLSATSIEMKGNMGVDVNLTGPGAMGDISSTTQDNIKNTLATALTSIFNADGSQKDPSLHQPRV